MREVFLVLWILLVSGLNAGWSDKDVYTRYLENKKAAIEEENKGNFLVAGEFYYKAGEVAEGDNLLEVAGWMFNNSGYMLIKEFLRSGNKKFLIQAREVLLRAKKCFKKENVKVENNLTFIKNYLTKN